LKVAEVERLKLMTSNTHDSSWTMGDGAESGEGFLDYPAVSLVLAAHYDEPGTRIQIASQFLGQLLFQILLASNT
jgi:hypothetical protein